MATGGRTALVQPALEQLGKRLGAFLPPSFLVDDAPQLGQTTMEALEVRLVVHCGFVHVAEDLLFKEYRCKQGGLRLSTYPHGGNLAVYRRCVTGLVDGEVEEREQSEYVSEGGVEPVVIGRFDIADIVKVLDCEELWAVWEHDRWTTDLDL